VTPTALTASQEAALAALVQARRLVRVTGDPAKATRFLTSARTGLADLEASASSLSPRSRHRLAYDAAHDAVEALLAAYGYRTATGPGAHQALASAVESILDAPPEVAAAAASYDPLRQKRNSDHYRAEVITASEAERATRIATLLVGATAARLT
jgi:hypothetical protein